MFQIHIGPVKEEVRQKQDILSHNENGIQVSLANTSGGTICVNTSSPANLCEVSQIVQRSAMQNEYSSAIGQLDTQVCIFYLMDLRCYLSRKLFKLIQ